ncbi:hypothetical protein HNR59_001203 [Aquamicrobium lusatiense]|uniref:Uncharacterized protein n=1 Tax=Aquamicrobium lusatiense TaxID=89772 RepID=A0A7W9S2P5_9HYPH|nr:hypothetical protein [Aquamicrobium lusatiense]MBB6011858.1 hypothetical protein [Aquamicrobium lusatiense]
MEMYVEPAKRPGRRKLIRKSPLMPTAITHDIDGIWLTMDAEGIYDASTYRYTLKLSSETVAMIIQTWVSKPLPDRTALRS